MREGRKVGKRGWGHAHEEEVLPNYFGGGGSWGGANLLDVVCLNDCGSVHQIQKAPPAKLFIQEPGEQSPSEQRSMLKFLIENNIQPVGSQHAALLTEPWLPDVYCSCGN